MALEGSQAKQGILLGRNVIAAIKWLTFSYISYICGSFLGYK